MSSLTNSDIISIASAIIAFCALGLTLCEARLSRKHNRLSVMPSMHINADMYFTHDPSNNQALRFAFKIVNKGLGPGIIEKIKCIYQGQDILIKDNFSVFLDAQLEKIQEERQQPLGCHIKLVIVGKGSVLNAQEELVFIDVECVDFTTETYGDLREIFEKLNFQLTYKSFYDEQGYSERPAVIKYEE